MNSEDGIGRNIAKLRSEWQTSRIGMVPHWDRMRRHPDLHAYVNLFVESRRLSPYLWGHVDAVLYPLIIAALVWGGARLW